MPSGSSDRRRPDTGEADDVAVAEKRTQRAPVAPHRGGRPAGHLPQHRLRHLSRRQLAEVASPSIDEEPAYTGHVDIDRQLRHTALAAQVASEAVQQQAGRPDPSPTRSGHPLPPSLETGEGITSPSRGIVPTCSPEDPLPGRPIQAQAGTTPTSDQSALSRCRDNADSEREALSFPGAVASPRTSSSVRLTRLSWS